MVVVHLGCIRRTPPRCGAVSPQCSLVVASDVAWSLISVALMVAQLVMVLALQLVVQLLLGRLATWLRPLIIGRELGLSHGVNG